MIFLMTVPGCLLDWGILPEPMHTCLSVMAETSSQDLTRLCLRPAQQCSLVPGGWTQAPK
uniref:Uncharacterized protein n=1 Tax=Colobus angolensis palliatus TaxID=336983 RepID=A0A2K5I8N7_COLAP